MAPPAVRRLALSNPRHLAGHDDVILKHSQRTSNYVLYCPSFSHTITNTKYTLWGKKTKSASTLVASVGFLNDVPLSFTVTKA